MGISSLSEGHYKNDVRIRGLPLSTYAQRGRGGVGPNAYVVYRLSQARLGEFAYKGGRGVQKAVKSAYVLNGSPLRPSSAPPFRTTCALETSGQSELVAGKCQTESTRRET